KSFGSAPARTSTRAWSRPSRPRSPSADRGTAPVRIDLGVVSFRAMRAGVLVAVATLVALVVAPSAAAALEAHLSVGPSVVDVGGVVRVELRTFLVEAGVRRLDDPAGSRLRVEIVSPESRVIRLGLRHVARGVWRGTYRLR